MKRESRTVDRSDQVDSLTQRHLPLVDLFVDTRSELMELAVASGLKVLQTMLEDDRTAICGERYRHRVERQASRAGTVPSEVGLGGRKVALRRPRARARGAEVPLPTFHTMASDDPRNRRGVWQRRLDDLQSRGLRTDRSVLVILDGSKALHKAVTQTFGRAALIQRCQVHKLRNILEHLPEGQRPWVRAIVARAYRQVEVAPARRLLQDLARRLDDRYPSAAVSIREGLDDTLTVLTLGLSDRLRQSVATTNAIESLISRTRHVKRRVKRWRSGQMVLRWTAAAILEAVKGFRRLKAHRDMPKLLASLRARDQQLGIAVSVENVA